GVAGGGGGGGGGRGDVEEVAGGVGGGRRGEGRAGAGREAVDVAVEAAAVSVDGDAGLLARLHLGRLIFLEVRDHPDVVERHDGEERPIGRGELADLDGAARDVAGGGRADRRVREGEIGETLRRLRLEELGLGDLDRGQRVGDLLRRGL